MNLFRVLPLWPLLQLAAVGAKLAAAVAPGSKVSKAAAIRLLGRLSWPVVALRAAGTTLRITAPDLHRSVRVWRHILPIFSSYMWTKWSTDLAAHLFRWDKRRVEARWQRRHDAGGAQVYDMITTVQGYYVKSGQVLATKREFVPLAWCRRLAHLWDNTKPRPWRNVRASIVSDLEATELFEQLQQLDPQQRRKHSKPRKAHPMGMVEEDVPPPPTQLIPNGTNAPETSSPVRAATANLGTRSTSGASTSVLARALSGTGWFLSRLQDTPGSPPPRAEASHAAWPHRNAATSVRAADELGEENLRDPRASLEVGLFTVSQSAAQVMAQRAQERPPAPQTKARRCKQDKRLAQWFERVEQTPMASASIAQVHSAQLAPSLMQLLGSSWQHGPHVVVKVQHADVQRLMGADLRNLGRIARFLNPFLPFDLTPALKEVQRVVPKEFDFQREARLMAALRARLARFPRIVVPEPIIAMSGPGIIVMQKMEGIPMTSLLVRAGAGDAEARQQAIHCLEPLLDAYGYMMLVDGLFHADPHPGNMLLQADGKVALLDFGQCKALTTDERLALCALYGSLVSGDLRPALHAIAPFGLTFGPAPPAPTTTADSSSTSDGSSSKGGQGSSDSASEAADAPVLSPRSSGLLSRLWSLGRAADGKGDAFSGVNLDAARKMLSIMFDTKWVAEGAYSFSGGDVVEGAPLTGFPAPLYLTCRAILILRGILHSLGVEDVSVASRWYKYAREGLREKRAVADARAAENAALDRGLRVEGL